MKLKHNYKGFLLDGSHSSTNAYSKLPSASELDLSENLFSDWDEITNVIVNLPSLKVINLQGNVFSKSVPTLEKTLNKLKSNNPENFNHLTSILL